jgi:Spy/CpxP family protein refolding chaperone
MSKSGKIFIAVLFVAVFAIAATSFAGWGRGGGRGWGGNCQGQGSGYGPKGYGGQGYQSNLSDEESNKLNQERQAFFEATSDLREQLYQKELELRSELTKPEPDAKKAAGLQKEISGLESDLDQKRLEQRIKMRKDFPQLGFRGQGYGRGRSGMGRGMMYGGGNCFGGGGYGPGSCWN